MWNVLSDPLRCSVGRDNAPFCGENATLWALAWDLRRSETAGAVPDIAARAEHCRAPSRPQFGRRRTHRTRGWRKHRRTRPVVGRVAAWRHAVGLGWSAGREMLASKGRRGLAGVGARAFPAGRTALPCRRLTAATGAPSADKRGALSRSGSVAFKTFKYVYGALALIPSGFTAASLVSAVALQDTPRARAFAFWAWTGWLALPLSVVLLAVAPFSLIVDPVDRHHLDVIQRTWAKWTVWPFFDIESKGVEEAKAYLKERGHGCVVVSNHRSMMDIYALFAALDIPLRFVSKQEIFFIPLVGWVMGLIGHVSLVRGDKKSGKTALDNCKYYLENGREWSVVFFAEGSRSRTPEEHDLKEFKIGAFKVAQSVKAPVLPVSISGTGAMMPAGEEFATLRKDIKARVVVHPPIEVTDDTDAEYVRSKCFITIYDGLVGLREQGSGAVNAGQDDAQKV